MLPQDEWWVNDASLATFLSVVPTEGKGGPCGFLWVGCRWGTALCAGLEGTLDAASITGIVASYFLKACSARHAA